MRSYLRQLLTHLAKGEQGITGLETAIILIAFVVVASVFAYTVLTAGMFSSQKSNEAVNAAVAEVRSSMRISGNTIAYKGAVDIDGVTTTADTVDAAVRIDITIGVALQGLPIDVTPAYQLNATNKDLESSGDTNSLVINLIDQNQVISDLAWTVAFTGADDGDFSLESTERAVISVWLNDLKFDATNGLYYILGTDETDPFFDASADLLGKFDSFALEIQPVLGAPLFIEKVIPQSLNDIMNLR